MAGRCCSSRYAESNKILVSLADFEAVTLTLDADKDETIYLGFHALSVKPEGMSVKIDDGVITAGVDFFAPDQVTGLEAEAVSAKTLFGSKACDIFSLTGQLVRKNAQNFKDLPAGIYVVGGKKVVVR